MTIYILDLLLFLFGTSLLFHVHFLLLLPDLHIGFSRGKSGVLVFPSLSEFSTVFCDSHKAFDCVDHNKLWKILKEMGILDHLTCLLRNLYAGQEATVRTGYGTTDWFQTGKGVCQGCILSPCLFNLHAEYITAVFCHPACLTYMQSTS